LHWSLFPVVLSPTQPKSHGPIGLHWSLFPVVLSPTQPKLQDHRYGASALHSMPVYSQPLLILIIWPWRVGMLSWHWYTVATAGIQSEPATLWLQIRYRTTRPRHTCVQMPVGCGCSAALRLEWGLYSFFSSVYHCPLIDRITTQFEEFNID